MRRLQKLFAEKKKEVLNIYFTAGFPHLESTLPIMEALQQNGADIIELGMPYSDPLADGPVIQQSNEVALQNGMNMHKLFQQLQSMRPAIHLPVILMGYLNPILQFGFENFCRMAKEVGIDGLILPDVPEYEYETQYKYIVNKYELDFVFLLTPETSADRIRKLDELSSGFLYAVSSSATTGSAINAEIVDAYLQKLKAMDLKNPVLVGFGIKDKLTFDAACLHLQGAIIGSAFIKALQASKADESVDATVKNFLISVKGN